MTTAVSLAQQVAPGVSLGFKNRIINGAMTIDQRNAGALISGASGYTLDRWYLLRGNISSNPVFNVQQSTTVPAGFKNSLSITVGTSGAPGTSNYSCFYQKIEGLNTADMNFGSANAVTFTLSFWVNCSVTGTYGVAFQNDATTRSYIATYTVNAANTWEYKTITVAGDVSGAWLTTNGVGIAAYWDLGVGTTQSTTAGSWQAGNYLGLTGGTKLSNTNGATFYITGVQLEVGTAATPFEFRDYGRELIMCQRYCYQVGGNGGASIYINPQSIPSSGTGMPIQFPAPVTMRTAPSVTSTISDGSYVASYSVSSTQWSLITWQINGGCTKSGSAMGIIWTGGTANTIMGIVLYATLNLAPTLLLLGSSMYIRADAEL